MYNNKVGKVIKKELQILEQEEATYNFEVEDNHNYYVSEECFLVHNKCINSERTVDTVDDALDEVEKFLGDSQSYYVNSKGEVVYNILISDSDPTKVARFDINPSSPHVMDEGLHINLEIYKKAFGTKGVKEAKINIHLKWSK